MPNMFGSGPLKMTLQQLANEVWEEVSRAPGQLWKGKKGWQRSRLKSNQRALLHASALPILTHSQPAAEPRHKDLACSLRFLVLI